MAKKSPSRRPPTPKELESQVRMWQADRWSRVARDLIKWGGLAICAMFLSGSIKELAGKFTGVQFGSTLSVDVKSLLPWIVSVAAAIWALWERSLRRSSIRSMGAHKVALERMLDPDRSSSRLTATGDTNNEEA